MTPWSSYVAYRCSRCTDYCINLDELEAGRSHLCWPCVYGDVRDERAQLSIPEMVRRDPSVSSDASCRKYCTNDLFAFIERNDVIAAVTDQRHHPDYPTARGPGWRGLRLPVHYLWN